MKVSEKIEERSHLTPVIYTMGKVGSTSISNSILKSGVRCFDIHTLREDRLLLEMSQAVEREKLPIAHFSISMAYRNSLFTQRRKCLYISMVREPIGRNMSAYFQNLKNFNIESKTGEIEFHFNNFREKYPHDLPLSWLDREFKEQLDIDVYKAEFDTKDRYSYLPRANTILFRVDCLNEVKEEVISTLIGRRINIVPENIGEQKAYHEDYQLLQKQAKFPQSFVDRFTKSKYCKHFWSPKEIEDMAQKYTV